MQIERWSIPFAVLGLLAMTPIASGEDEKGEKSKVKLPQAVAKTVKATYPSAKIVGTSKEKDKEGETVYEVELILKGKSVDLIIDEEGEIEETEKEISLSDLPSAVSKAISKSFPKAKIEKVEELTLEEDKVVYEVVLAFKGKKSMEVVFVPNGKILEPEDEDDDKPKAKKKEKGDDDEDDDKPKAKKKEKGDDDDEDDDKPKAKKKEKGDDDDDKPKAKKKEKGDDDEDDDKPKAKKKEKGDDDDDKPKAKKKEKGDDDDDKPKAKKKEKGDDDDEDDDKPKAKKKEKGDDDDEDDDKPKAKKKGEEDEDEKK